MRNQPEVETYCLPEGVVVYTMMRSVALDEKFDIRSSIRGFILSFIRGFTLNGDSCGLGSEIDYIQRRLVLSSFAFRANSLDNIPTRSPSHFQRELQGLC